VAGYVLYCRGDWFDRCLMMIQTPASELLLPRRFLESPVKNRDQIGPIFQKRLPVFLWVSRADELLNIGISRMAGALSLDIYPISHNVKRQAADPQLSGGPFVAVGGCLWPSPLPV